jgi:hypothetical protein
MNKGVKNRLGTIFAKFTALLSLRLILFSEGTAQEIPLSALNNAVGEFRLEMGGESSMEPGPDQSLTKELGRRRVSIFFWALLFIAIANVVNEENDLVLHVADDYADLALAVVALGIIALWRKRKSLKDLKKLNNVLAVLAVIVILATIFAITQEYTDPTDFGNEIPTLLFGIFLLINRFV